MTKSLIKNLVYTWAIFSKQSTNGKIMLKENKIRKILVFLKSYSIFLKVFSIYVVNEILKAKHGQNYIKQFKF